tara:strand:+ start:11359 stop:12807 length:1449 start_codon:yes stop_codon:yes gene_type:complete
MFMGEHFIDNQDLIEKYKDRGYSSNSDFGRYLHEIEPRRSADAWRVAVSRWVKKGNSYRLLTQTMPDEIPQRTHTYYDKENDKYITYIDGVNDLIILNGEKHREMRKAYCSMLENLSVEEMVTKFEMPTLWIKGYIRAYGWTHNMNPFTDEEIIDGDTDSLVKDLLTLKKKDILGKVEEKHRKSIERDANKYRTLEETILSDFREILKEKTIIIDEVHAVPMGKAESDYALVISPTDLHYGKYGWSLEVGESYNFEIARERLLDKTFTLLQRLPGAPEKIILATGSDWFHVDNDLGTTTRGTGQDMAGTPAQILMEGCELAVEHIEMLKSVAPVEIVFMMGNHDRFASLGLMMFLSATYENDSRVTVTKDPSLRQYIKWGDNLMGFTHGDFVSGQNLPLIMGNEKRKEWGETENHIWFHGHKHHTHMIEKGNCFVIQLPSLAGHDRYHFRKGFISRPGMFAHLIDREQGIVGSLYSPVMADE